MKRFLVKAILFIAVVIVGMVAIGVALPYNKNGYIRAQKYKMDKLAQPDRKPSIIILGGSNAAFGYDTKLLNDSLPMPVFNAGLHAGMGMKFFLDDCSQYLKKGDVLVFSPEYDQFYGNLNDGQGEMTDAFYLNHCHYPGKMSYKQFVGVVQNTPSFLKRKMEYNLFALAHLKTDPVYTLSSVNDYGDVTWHWYHNRAHGNPDGLGMDRGNLSFNEDAFNYMVSKMNELKRRGVRIVMYPAAFERRAFNGSRKTVAYISNRLQKAGYPYVCNPIECTFDTDKFYDTNYHLNHEGALLHNQHIIRILKSKLFQK